MLEREHSSNYESQKRFKSSPTHALSKKMKGHLTFFIVLIFIFCFILLLTYWTPMAGDDYQYSIDTKGFSTLIADEYRQYMTWTGRSVAHLILRIILKLPKAVFNILSATVFTFLVYLSSKISCGGKEIFRASKGALLLLLFALFFLFLPSFAEVFFWMSGTANYGLVMGIMLGFIYKYHHAVIDTCYVEHAWTIPMFFFWGIMAGWCNENTSIGVLLIIISYILIQRFLFKKQPFIWMYVGVLGNLIGLLFMLLAPGNAIRATYFPDRNNLSLVWKMLTGIPIVLNNLIQNAEPLLIISTFLLVALFWRIGVNKVSLVALVYYFSGLATILVLAASPAALGWSRSYFGGIFFIIISISTSIVGLLREFNQGDQLVLSVLAGYLIVSLVVASVTGVIDSYRNHVSYSNQMSILLKKQHEGLTNIVVPKLTYNVQTKYAIMDKTNISPNAYTPRNRQSAKYFGLRTIRSDK